MTMHTPGPWIDESMEFSAGWRCIVRAGQREFDIADPRDRKTDSEDAANARLVAAAPELLDACNMANVVFAEFVNESSPVAIIAIHKKLAAAIAKAESPKQAAYGIGDIVRELKRRGDLK